MIPFVPVIALHGGAGTILPSAMTPQKEAAYHAALRACLGAGLDVLKADQRPGCRHRSGDCA